MYSSLKDLDFIESSLAKSRGRVIRIFAAKYKEKLIWGTLWMAVGVAIFGWGSLHLYYYFFPKFESLESKNIYFLLFSIFSGIYIINSSLKYLKIYFEDPLFRCFLNPADFSVIQSEIFKAEFRYRRNRTVMDKIRVSAKLGPVIVTEEFGHKRWREIIPLENDKIKADDASSKKPDAVPCLILYNKNFPKMASICALDLNKISTIKDW